MIKMEEIANGEISLVVDRGIKKYRMNIVKSDRIFGFLKPV